MKFFAFPLVAEAFGGVAFPRIGGWSFPSFPRSLEHTYIISVSNKKTSLFSIYFHLFFSFIFEKTLDISENAPYNLYYKL